MEIHSKKLILFGRPKYTLTVVTSPSDAVCEITANGSTVTAKSITLDAGTYVTVTVSYSNTETKTYNLTLNRNTTLTFTRVSSSSTSFINDVTVTGSYDGFNTSTGIVTMSRAPSAARYIDFPSTSPVYFENRDVEMATRIKYNGISSGNANIITFGAAGSRYCSGFGLQLRAGKIFVYISASSSKAPGYQITSTKTIITNAWTDINFIYSESKKTGDLYYTASDGALQHDTWSSKNGDPKYGSNMIQRLLWNSGDSNDYYNGYWLGQMDLMKTDVYIDNSRFWGGRKWTTIYYFDVSVS